MSVEEVADGAIRVAIALMAAEASNVLARRGVDAPRFRMVAFGGAGPLVAALLAEEIGIDAILIPPFPGALSAPWARRAPTSKAIWSAGLRAAGRARRPTALARLTAELAERARHWIAEQTARLPVTGMRVESPPTCATTGQGYDVTVPFEAAWLARGDVAAIAAAFHAAHRATYGHANEQAEVWLKELRAHVIGVMPKPRVVAAPDAAAVSGAGEDAPVRLFGRECRSRRAWAAPRLRMAAHSPGRRSSTRWTRRPDTARLERACRPIRRAGAGARAMKQDAVTTEVFANLFKAIVDEMAWVVLRSSHTTFVKETQDFGVALVTAEGETFA